MKAVFNTRSSLSWKLIRTILQAFCSWRCLCACVKVSFYNKGKKGRGETLAFKSRN